MSRRTREINRVTGGIISISLKLILLALVCILMYEGVARGYSFGHEISRTDQCLPTKVVALAQMRRADILCPGYW